MAGETASTQGVAVFGENTATSGINAGVLGAAQSSAGSGVAGFAARGGLAGYFVSDSSGSTPIFAIETANINNSTLETSGETTRMVLLANGTLAAQGFAALPDFAEMIEPVGDKSAYAPGDVLVIDPHNARSVAKSSDPYTTLVAGIYSTKPGFIGAPPVVADDGKAVLGIEADNLIPMAILGIVPCKVSAENGPIAPGDLLVTSSTPGHAMKGTRGARMVGAIVGKALGSLGSGTGVIEVLVTLQ